MKTGYRPAGKTNFYVAACCFSILFYSIRAIRHRKYYKHRIIHFVMHTDKNVAVSPVDLLPGMDPLEDRGSFHGAPLAEFILYMDFSQGLHIISVDREA